MYVCYMLVFLSYWVGKERFRFCDLVVARITVTTQHPRRDLTLHHRAIVSVQENGPGPCPLLGAGPAVPVPASCPQDKVVSPFHFQSAVNVDLVEGSVRKRLGVQGSVTYEYSGGNGPKNDFYVKATKLQPDGSYAAYTLPGWSSYTGGWSMSKNSYSTYYVGFSGGDKQV